jgi:hypothetical protein
VALAREIRSTYPALRAQALARLADLGLVMDGSDLAGWLQTLAYAGLPWLGPQRAALELLTAAEDPDAWQRVEEVFDYLSEHFADIIAGLQAETARLLACSSEAEVTRRLRQDFINPPAPGPEVAGEK